MVGLDSETAESRMGRLEKMLTNVNVEGVKVPMTIYVSHAFENFTDLGDLESTMRICLEAAIEHLESKRRGGLRDLYFYVWGENDLEICNAVAGRIPGLTPDKVKGD